MKSAAILAALLILCALAADAQSPDKRRVLKFSGYRWIVKNASEPAGPGPNYFSGRDEDVFVDKQGRLHLKIVKRDGRWYSTEVYSEKNFGYGTYVFFLASRVDQLEPNAVLGLYTWDNNTFQTDANSEVDIEFARWGTLEQKILQYSVQPTRGPDVPAGQYYKERFAEVDWLTQNPASAHRFTWTDKGVIFESSEVGGKSPIGKWEMRAATEQRRAKDGANISAPVSLPRPGRTTKAQMNLWLADLNGDGLGDPPKDGNEVEVVIEKFEFIPAKK
jgi:hypothetical protein